MEWLRIQREVPGVGSETVFSIGSFPVTNSFLMIVGIMLMVAVVAWYAQACFKERPGVFQNMLEWLYESMKDFATSIMGSIKEESLIFSLVTALFLYVGVANLVTIIPGVASLTYGGVSIFRSPTSDFNTTLGLALAMVILIQFYAFKQLGFFGYVGKFIQIGGVIKGFKEGIGAGCMASINFLIGLLDIVSEAAKVVSLSLRLFGNIYAGEVLAVIILGALAYVLPATWMALNILFALVQAVVFGALVAAYYSIAVTADETTVEA